MLFTGEFRFEFLGPLPRVAGYEFQKATGEAFIEWYDTYLKTKWVGPREWRNEVYFDEEVKGWVSVPRGDYSRNFDFDVYAGAA
jgi:hypothetical protein